VAGLPRWHPGPLHRRRQVEVGDAVRSGTGRQPARDVEDAAATLLVGVSAWRFRRQLGRRTLTKPLLDIVTAYLVTLCIIHSVTR
jgi:hypothetical protein